MGGSIRSGQISSADVSEKQRKGRCSKIGELATEGEVNVQLGQENPFLDYQRIPQLQGMLSARGESLLFADADGATHFPDIEKLEEVLTASKLKVRSLSHLQKTYRCFQNASSQNTEI